jgi:hypothetical protein
VREKKTKKWVDTRRKMRKIYRRTTNGKTKIRGSIQEGGRREMATEHEENKKRK